MQDDIKIYSKEGSEGIKYRWQRLSGQSEYDSEEDSTALTLLYIKSGFVCIQARPKSEAPDNNRDKKISDKTTYGIKIHLRMHYVLNKTKRLAKTDIYTLSFPA